jgi:hypothetical protein
MLLNNDRLSHWCLGVFFSWIVCFLLFGIPLFHLWLGFSIAKIAISLGICCGVQLAITPWLYSSRATPQNPDGLVGRRAAAVFVWFSLTALLLFYYIQRGWPSNPTAEQARIIMSVALVTKPLASLVVCFAFGTKDKPRATPTPRALSVLSG